MREGGSETKAEEILVVDDEKEIADLVAPGLENENYQVYKYYTAEEALACIQRGKDRSGFIDGYASRHERPGDMQEDKGKIYISCDHADNKRGRAGIR